MNKKHKGFPCIITNDTISISIENQSYTFDSSHKYYNNILNEIVEGNWDKVSELVDLSKEVEKYSEGNFKSEEGLITLDGEVIDGAVGHKIVDFMAKGLPYQPLIEFVKRLRKNPSNVAIQRLYECLEHNHHPITPDGRFLAYKKVRNDFKDIYTGKIDNSIGTVVKMPRSKVNDDNSVTCSHGLHVASFDYAAYHYGATGGGVRLLEVAVDPEHVVSIPHDYNNQKMRVCEYEVMGESDWDKEAHVYHERTEDYIDDWDDEWDESWDDLAE